MRKMIGLFLAATMLTTMVGCGSTDGGTTAATTGGTTAGTTGGTTASTGDTGVDFPTENITMVIPQGLGGGSDLIGRTLATEMEKELGVSIIVENLDGGSTAIGMQRVADAEPDGYTIGMSITNLATLQTLGYSDLSYKDFEAICAANYDAAVIMIRTDDDRFSNFEELIEYCKAHPGESNWGTGAAGGMWHLAIMSLCNAADMEVNIVPNSGGGIGVGQSLVNGDIDVAVFSPVDCMAQIDAGQIFPVMSMTPDRMASFPDAPTAAECGYDIVCLATRGFVAPKGTPKEVIEVLEAAFEKAENSQAFGDFIGNMESNLFWLGAEDYCEFMQEEIDIYVPLLEQSGIVQ